MEIQILVLGTYNYFDHVFNISAQSSICLRRMHCAVAVPSQTSWYFLMGMNYRCCEIQTSFHARSAVVH